MKRALLIVDMQNDFMPKGALAIEGADQIVSIINQLQDVFDTIIATKDWHPGDHKSFALQHNKKPFEIIEYKGVIQELWPVHCVESSFGSEFHPDLKTDKIEKIIFKGLDKEVDSYSAFFDNAHIRSTGLLEYLKDHQITEIAIVGVATDYCVKYSVLDAIQNGIKAIVIKDACRGVNLHPGDVEKAYELMEAMGATILYSNELKN